MDLEWKYREVLLGFEPVTEQHTGQNLAKIIVDVLENCDISTSRLFTITSDNASNNGTMIDHLQDGLQILHKDLNLPDLTHIPCLAHVIQLALNCLIKTIRIRPRDRIITRWDENEEQESIESIVPEDGAPWTLKKVRELYPKLFEIIIVIIILASRNCYQDKWKLTATC